MYYFANESHHAVSVLGMWCDNDIRYLVFTDNIKRCLNTASVYFFICQNCKLAIKSMIFLTFFCCQSILISFDRCLSMITCVVSLKKYQKSNQCIVWSCIPAIYLRGWFHSTFCQQNVPYPAHQVKFGCPFWALFSD